MEKIFGNFLTILFILSQLLLEFAIPKGIYFVEERNGKTYTQPLTSHSPKQIGEQIKALFDIDIDENNDNSEAENQNQIASTYMMKLFKKLEDLENYDQHSEDDTKTWLNADKIVSVIAQDVSNRLPDGSYRIRFSKNDLPMSNDHTILKAQLRVHVNGIISPIFVYFHDLSVYENTLVVSNKEPIVVNDVTALLTKWIEDSSSIPLISLHTSTETNLKMEAFLVIALQHVSSNQKRRSRREIPAAPLTVPKKRRSESAYFERPENNAVCQKKGLYVDFEALGWKQWVIAPEGFSAFYCAGACSAPFHRSMNATSHAIVQSLIHLVRPNVTTAAKCAPSSLSSMKILFLDQKKNVQIKRYRDMVVKECGCH